MRPATIRSSREIDRIFREGARSASGSVVVLAAPTPRERGLRGRVAFIAGTKLGGAVVRNRAKRLLREAGRMADAPRPGWDILILARPATLSRKPAEIADDLRRLLGSLGIPS